MTRLVQFYYSILNLFRQDKLFGARRSGQWRRVRKDFIKGKVCAVCGGKKKLEVHHVVPVHLDKSLELEENNLIALCRGHHFLFGHLLSWWSYNPDIKEDARAWYNKIKTRS